VAASSDARLLPIDADLIKKVMAKYKTFVPAAVPADSYNWIDAHISTLAVEAVLMARRDLDNGLVYQLAKTLVEKQPELAQSRVEARKFSGRRAVRAPAVPLQPGAEKYYREIGVVK